MFVRCEIDGCSDAAQSKLTTSGYELCPHHYDLWLTKNMFVVEERGAVVLADPTAHRS